MKKFTIILAIIAAVSSQLLTPEKLKEIVPLITGGSPAAPGQIPYQVAVLTTDGKDVEMCGGTLIKHKWILTAASCLQLKITQFVVAFGNIDLLEDEPAFVYNSTTTSEIKIHPDFNSVTNVNDIALIKIDNMPENITNHKNVGYIGLPTEDEAKTNLTGRDITISGYGLNGEETQTTLMIHYTTIKLTTNDVCKDFRLNQGYYNITDSTLCIDTIGGKSPCLDGGGPMTIEIGTKKVLVGILGMGPVPCTSGYPALGESVFFHREWIEKTSGSSEVSLSFSMFAALVLMTLRNLF